MAHRSDGGVALGKSGGDDIHEHWHELIYTAFPRMLEPNLKPDLTYIDGDQNVEYVVADLFYGNKLLGQGGGVSFNDCGGRPLCTRCYGFSPHTAAYRRYSELDMGLSRVYRGRTPYSPAYND